MNRPTIVRLFACTLAIGACDIAGGPSSARYGVKLDAAALPHKGDRDGSGNLILRFERDPARACYELTLSGVEAPIAGHVRRRIDGEPGEAALELFRGSQLTSVVSGAAGGGAQSYEGRGCLRKPDPEAVGAILDDPSSYYVAIPTQSHPAGAIGGELEP